MWWILLGLILVIILFDRILHKNFYNTLQQGPSPPSLPIIGHITLFSSLPTAKGIIDKKAGNSLTIVVLSSNDHIEKGESYNFTIPWIGRGLLTSAGEKWRSHRKMITPAFHFKILTEFLEIFHRNGNIMCELLENQVGKGPVNIYNYVNLMALDNIYESAMGTNARIQQDGSGKYVRAVKTICSIINARAFSFPLRSNFIFRLSSLWPKSKQALEVLHNTTKDVIHKRKQEFLKERENNEGSKIKEVDDDGFSKKRHAFLDKLITLLENQALTENEVREEVDTFMFEGHDTISSGLSFVLYSLAKNPQVQQKAYEEQQEIFGSSDRIPTTNDLQNMQYLDRVIKESQRLYPSVPLIERHLQEDLHLPEGKIISKGSGITLFIYALHRDPEIWTDPDTFNPDNFLPEAVLKRNPFCYVPFSAGPRNCIGQRFAMMEMKTTVSKVIRKFELLPSTDPAHELELVGELVLISRSGFHVNLKKRDVVVN